MNNMALSESITCSGKPVHCSPDCLFDDACILDMDYFVRTVSGIKAKGVRPELIGSIITNYASKFLPDLNPEDNLSSKRLKTIFPESPESVTASWLKKRFFVETLVGILPPERDSVPCNFLLRLLRVGNMVSLENAYRVELENRISWQLDQASLKELMIPSFSHTCGTLLDVELVIRLVQRFVSLDEAVKSGAGVVKVAKLVDSYLAEAGLDANLALSEFVALAVALPSHARAADDGLYRAIDTYLKAHPGVSKQERKSLCRLIDCRKLSTEASLHAAQNERLPVRSVIQVLYAEQNKLNYKHNIDWSGSFSGTRSPAAGLEVPGRCHSKREINAQHLEIKRLKEDVLKLQSQCISMQGQIERLTEKKKGFFSWKKIGIPSLRGNVIRDVEGDYETGFGRTPVNMKARLVKGRRTPNRWRKSMS